MVARYAVLGRRELVVALVGATEEDDAELPFDCS